jgi:hypothetical protein
VAAIFVSYRKQGADKGRALHLAQDLRAAFGDDAVFIDEQTYALGRIRDFVGPEVTGCKALIVVIGQTWMERRRDLLDERDWVRREIESGLRQGSLIVPVIVDDSQMPKKADLPDAIAELADWHAIPLYARHWKDNVDRLIDLLGQKLRLQRKRASNEVPNLSGDWIDTEGVHVKLVHRGDEIKIYLMSGGRPMGEADASIEGNQVRFTIWRPDLGKGRGVGTVSPDGRQISGSVQYGFQSYGFSISRR